MTARPEPTTDPGVILEFTPLGAIVRVSALDTATLTEVVIQGPAGAGRAALERAALAKLAYVLERQRQGRQARRGQRV